jgi:soluble lytic murein transglycosylase
MSYSVPRPFTCLSGSNTLSIAPGEIRQHGPKNGDLPAPSGGAALLAGSFRGGRDPVLRHINTLNGAVFGIALLIGAGFSLGSSATAESETAALPPLGGASEPLGAPSVLPLSDADLYARIFDLQRDGDWAAADRLIARLGDDLLMGHVLYQRYMHPTKYRSRYDELKAWMAEYADHPGAARIYALALKRRPANHAYPAKPRAVDLPNVDLVESLDGLGVEADDDPVVMPDSRKLAGKTSAQRQQIRAVQRQVRHLVQRGNVTNALEHLSTRANKRLFDPVSYAESLGVVARGYYRYHYDDKAMAVAAEAADLAGDDAARAHWWGGLSAWRAGAYDIAAAHFEALSGSVEADDWLRAAGGFWASRAYLVGQRPGEVSRMLRAASLYPRTFYGLLATRALGETPPLDFEMPVLSETTSELMARIPAARRAIALAEVGQTDLADAELRRFVDELPPSLAVSLLALADATGMADVAFRLGHDMLRGEGLALDGALYPVPGWRPSEGFSVDRALVFAIVRQESRFRVRAQSRAGARGLMQLMPTTAGYMAGRRFSGSARSELFDPDLNLSLGQKYIQYILGQEYIDGNLLYGLAAYNAGPGNLLKWRDRVDYAGDPLLFIESLPSRETRKYIERVLSNYWIYRMRLGQEPVSMDALIGGDWPTYIGQDAPGRVVARTPASSGIVAD